MEKNDQRFLVLDAWRGIGAIAVIVFHFSFICSSHISMALVNSNAALFVDFFFVLSGFVISAVYLDRLKAGYPIKDYILLRLGRVYPVHFLVLMMFLALELAKYFIDYGHPPFTSEYKSFHSLIANIFLVQGLGFYDIMTWNAPSWSISTEFYTYIAFAVCVVLFRNRIIWVALAAMLICTAFFVYLHIENIEDTYQHFFIRCIFSFSAGVLCYRFSLRLTDRIKQTNLILGSVPEFIVTLLALWALLVIDRQLCLIVLPYVLFVVVLVFSWERGIMSKYLKSKFFLFLSMLSFSTYMLHFFILSCIENVVKIAQGHFGIEMTRTVQIYGKDMTVIGFSETQGDILVAAYVVVTLIASAFMFFLVEKPIYLSCKNYIKNKQSKSLLPDTQTA
jgi:peptidoglycan/LPS O-acetylase OafA/YrhL